jgi:hypothetical protein
MIYTGKKVTGARCPRCGMAAHAPDRFCLEGAGAGPTIDFALPGKVWDDYLNPDCSSMQAELEEDGLPKPERKRAGKGERYVYRGVPLEVAEYVAEYLASRAEMLLGQMVVDPYDPFEKAERAMFRAALDRAADIRAAIAAAREATS